MNLRTCFLSILLSMACCASELFAQEMQSGSDNPFAQAKFVPDISFILDASGVWRDRRDAEIQTLAAPGFTSDDVNHQAGMTAHQGFNLNYGELVLSSVVDPFFDLFVNCEIGEETFEIEEAYFTTRRMPWGLQIKGGKFLSHFGRLNSQHTHQWDFADAPLIYSLLFGESMLNEKGLRLTWVAPIDTYFMLGGEISQGENSMSFGHDGFSDPSGQVRIESGCGPNLLVMYAKSSGDVGNLTVLGGLSFARGRSRMNEGLEEGKPLARARYGRTSIAAADLTLKYLFDSVRNLTLQAEYLYRDGDGDAYFVTSSGALDSAPYKQRQGGFYLQLVGRLSKRVRIGARHDCIPQNVLALPGETADPPAPLHRYSIMADYNPTEFSRLRLQYAQDRSRYAREGVGYVAKPVNEIILQINLAIGAHGAHAF